MVKLENLMEHIPPVYYKVKKSLLSVILASAIYSMSVPVQAANCAATISGAQGTCTLANGIDTTITNTGSVTGGIDTSSTFTSNFTIDNGGQLLNGGNANALYHDFGTWTGDVINNGLIDGTGAGRFGFRLAFATLDGDINNGGTIQADEISFGMHTSTVTGSLTNSGTITATLAGSTNIYAIDLYSSDIQGGIINTGTISIDGSNTGASYGINLHGTAEMTGLLDNSGSITGGHWGVYVGNGIDWSGSNTGDVAVNNRVGGSIDSGFLIGGTISGDFVNAGTINQWFAWSGAITLSGSGDISGLLTNSGTISAYHAILIDSANANLSGGIVNTGTLTGTSGIALRNNSSNIISLTNSGTINGDLQNADVTLSGGSITGNITGGLTFAAAATMTGDVTGNLSVNDGISATINGNYTQNASDTFTVQASNNSAYGNVTVTGTANLPADAKVFIDVNSVNSLASGNTLSSVLSATTLNASTFVTTDNSAIFDFVTSINGNALDVSVEKLVSVLDAVNNNGLYSGTGAATVFDYLIDNGGGSVDMSSVTTALGQLATEREVSDAVETTLPGISGGVALMTNFVTNEVQGLVSSRQDNTRGLAAGDGFITNRHFWLKPFGGWTEQDDTQGVTGYDIDSYGLAIGVDGDVSESWNVGLAFAYIDSDVKSNLTAGKHNINMDSYLAKVYAMMLIDDVTALNIQLGAGISDYDSNRLIFNGDIAKADYDSWNVQVSAELERNYQLAISTLLTPYIRADYGYVNVEDYRESGAGALNLNVDADSSDSLVLSTGLKASHRASESLNLFANAGIGYDIMTDRSSLTSSFAGGGAQFTTEGIEPEQWVYNAGLGAKYSLENGAEITASYNLDARQDYTDQSVSANVRLIF